MGQFESVLRYWERGRLARSERAARKESSVNNLSEIASQGSHLRRIAGEGARAPSKRLFANSKLTYDEGGEECLGLVFLDSRA